MLSGLLEQFRSAGVACARLGLVAFADAVPGVLSVLLLSELIIAFVQGGTRAMWAQLPYLLGNFLFGMSSIVAINSTVTQLHSKLTSQSDGRVVPNCQTGLLMLKVCSRCSCCVVRWFKLSVYYRSFWCTQAALKSSDR